MAAPFNIPQAADQQCLSRVELRVECRNLMNKDVMSKSDPCAVMFMSRSGNYMEEVRSRHGVPICAISVGLSACLSLSIGLSVLTLVEYMHVNEILP